MITAIEYEITANGVTRRIAADKNVMERGKWHLARIDGNGLPDTSALGAATFGLAGQSFTGVSVGARNMTINLYADGANPYELQEMLSDSNFIFSLGNSELGTLKLGNKAGEWYRIRARVVGYDIERLYRSSALVRVDLVCPFTWFEDYAETVFRFVPVSGGKSWTLQRNYTFENIDTDYPGGGSQYTKDFELINGGDVTAPLTIHLAGTSIVTAKVTINGYEMVIQDIQGSGASSIEICTDPDNLGAWLDDGTPADPYIQLTDTLGNAARLSDMQLKTGINSGRVQMLQGSLDISETLIKWRGRYTLCL